MKNHRPFLQAALAAALCMSFSISAHAGHPPDDGGPSADTMPWGALNAADVDFRSIHPTLAFRIDQADERAPVIGIADTGRLWPAGCAHGAETPGDAGNIDAVTAFANPPTHTVGSTTGPPDVFDAAAAVVADASAPGSRRQACGGWRYAGAFPTGLLPG